MMKTTTLFYKAMVLLAVTFGFMSGHVMAEDTTDISRGAKAWANNCARCHNMRDASEFRDDLWQPIVNHMRLRAGLPGDLARDIRAFLQSSNYSGLTPVSSNQPSATGNLAPAATATTALSGKAVFDQTCVACHGADGQGAIPGVPALQDRLSKPNADLLQHTKDGFQSPGSVMAMPPRGGNPALTDADLKNVLEYMRQQFGR